MTHDREDQLTDTPYRDVDVLQRLYVDGGLSAQKIADRFDVCHATILNWLEKHGIDRRDRSEWDSWGNTHVPHFWGAQGYETWNHGYDNQNQHVGVHRLLAIAAGADPYEVFGDGHHVHHKNGVPWDNRPCNLEVLTHEQHSKITHATRERNEREQYV